MYEIKEWHFQRECRSETPQYSDDGNIGGEIFLNIPPYPPQNLQLENVNNRCHLTWDENLEYDLDHYHVYRYIATDQATIPAPVYWPLIGETEDNEFTDEEFAPIPGGPETAHYRITALDDMWQESDFSDPVGSHGYFRPLSEGELTCLGVSRDALLTSVQPNPFNPITMINFSLPEAMHVTLKIYDISGREVAVPVNGVRQAGENKITSNAINLPSGVYVYNLQAGDFATSGKMVLMK